jgi:signal transduction histidine kinase
MITQSIRWRLSLSFAAIALLAALSLGAVLLTILRDYYTQREKSYLLSNAVAISADMAQLVQEDAPPEAIQSQVENLAFLSQTRVRRLDTGNQALNDSGQVRNLTVAVGAVARSVFFQSKVEGPLTQDYVRFISIGGEFTPPDSAIIALDRVPRPGRALTTSQSLITTTVVISSAATPVTIPMPPDSIERPVVIALKSMPIAGTLFGFGLNTEMSLSGRRSNQIIQLPIHDDAGQLLGYIELSEGPAYGRDVLESVAWGWAIASLVSVVLAAGVGWLISRRISAPILALTVATTRMAGGELTTRADVSGRDEFGRLARSFNEMAGRVEATIMALRRFVSDAAHELHTPLTALRTNLELASNENDEAVRRNFIDRAQAQVIRLETLTRELLDLSRIEAGADRADRTTLDMVALVQTTSEPYASQAEQVGITLSLDLPAQAVMVNGNEAQLRRALGNLLDNACKFTPEGGAVNVTLRQSDGWTELCVADTGIGIPADDLPQLFSRFHRGRNVTAYPGSGLGLAIVKAIVESHGGQVTAENTSPGACFCLRFPDPVVPTHFPLPKVCASGVS